MEVPVKYAKSGDVHLAYRIFGEGPRDIVLVPGTLSHAELSWERAAAKHLLERLTAFARVIVFDKRGQGLSDRNVAAEQTVEERIIDIRAVMDAAGSERATIYGWRAAQHRWYSQRLTRSGFLRWCSMAHSPRLRILLGQYHANFGRAT